MIAQITFHDIDEIAASAAVRSSDLVVEIKDINVAMERCIYIDWDSIDIKYDKYLIVPAEAIESLPCEVKYSGIFEGVVSVLDILDNRRSSHLLREIAGRVLAHWGLERLTDRMLSSLDGVAILANCCNAAAKMFNHCLYAYKPYLVRQCAQHPDAWANDGIVYVETGIGAQVSFHVFEGEDDGLPEANGRQWSGMHLQDFSDSLAIMHVAGIAFSNVFCMSVNE